MTCGRYRQVTAMVPDMIAMHAEGEHFLTEIGLPTRLENKDREVAAGVALGDGLAANGEPLVDADGSLVGEHPLKQIGSEGNGDSTEKVKVSALASFDKFIAASRGARLDVPLTPTLTLLSLSSHSPIGQLSHSSHFGLTLVSLSSQFRLSSLTLVSLSSHSRLTLLSPFSHPSPILLSSFSHPSLTLLSPFSHSPVSLLSLSSLSSHSPVSLLSLSSHSRLAPLSLFSLSSLTLLSMSSRSSLYLLSPSARFRAPFAFLGLSSQSPLTLPSLYCHSP
jgi:hypothetical protein